MTPKPSNRKGVTFSEEVFDAICTHIASGKSLRSVCRMPGMPSLQSVMNWVNGDAKLLERYARACDERTEAMFEEIMEIADNATDHNKARLQVDARKWMLSKMVPRKYGDKLDLTNNGESFNAPTVVVNPVGEMPEKT